MQAELIFPGSYHISEGEHALLAGCPPEIVKVLIQRGLRMPRHLLLPDFAVSQGETQVAVEFPLYQYLFNQRSGEKPVPLELLGSRRRVDAAEELLRLTLFGPTVQEMKQWGETTEHAEALEREMRWFHWKGADGGVPSITTLIRKTVVAEGAADLGWATVQRLRPNGFRVVSAKGGVCELNLNLEGPQQPPYPVPIDLTPTTLVKLGVEVLGGSTGFSATQASSGLALCYNGQYVLVDAIPYLKSHLHARGIARNQVRALFLSHIHDDHCNLISLLQHERRIDLLTTPLIYRMMLRKLHLILDRNEQSLGEYFHFVPLAPGTTTNYFGLHVTPFYSSHSVPTIGARFETMHDGANYRILFTGDTQSLADLKRMRRTGVIRAARYREIAGLYRQPAQLLIADGGEGVIHGDPGDAMSSPAERVVILHLDKLAERFDAHFSIASAGKRFTVLEGGTDYNLTRTIEFLLEYFPEMPPMWISNLLSNQQVLKFNTGDIIIREGAHSEGRVYMILTGQATVMHYNGSRKILQARMGAGEIIGEMSIITGRGVRNASVVAETPVIITALSELAFREYVRHQNLEPKLKNMWQHRELLQTRSYLKSVAQPVIRELSLNVTLEYRPTRPGPIPLLRLGERFSLVMPLDRKIILKARGKADRQVSPAAPILCQPGVTLVTEAPLNYLLLRAERASELRARIPAFRYFWEETLGLPIPAGGS